MNLYLLILSGLYTAGFMIAPIMSNRIVAFVGVPVALGSVVVAIVSGVIDVINNCYGLQRAKAVVLASLIVRLMLYVLISLVTLLPIVRETEGFKDVVLTGLRIIIASECASFVSQYFIDIRIFDYFRRTYSGFVIRYNGSNLISSAVNSIVFVNIAFYGTSNADLMASLIVGGYVMKMAIQVALTPLFSLLAGVGGYLEKRA